MKSGSKERCGTVCPEKWNPRAVCQKPKGHDGNHVHHEPVSATNNRIRETVWRDNPAYLNVMIW